MPNVFFCAALFFLFVGPCGVFFPIFPQIAEMEGILSTRNDETKELKVKGQKETCYLCRNANFSLRVSKRLLWPCVILVLVELRVGTT